MCLRFMKSCKEYNIFQVDLFTELTLYDFRDCNFGKYMYKRSDQKNANVDNKPNERSDTQKL